MVAADFAHRGSTPRADSSGNNTDGAEGIQGSSLKVLAGDVFEGLPARPEVDAVADFGVSRDSADFGIEEVRDQAADGVGCDDGIGINADEDLFIAQVLQAEVQGFGLAGVGFCQNHDLAAGCLLGEGGASYLEGTIFRAIVDDDDMKIGIIGIERGTNGALDNFFLVVCGNQHGDIRFVASFLAGPAVGALTQTIEDGECTDEEQASGHQEIADEEEPVDASLADVEQFEADPVEAR